jgi:acetyl esterase/lipase
VTRRGFSALLASLPMIGLAGPVRALTSFGDLLARKRAGPDKRVAYGADPAQHGELWLPAGKGPHPVVALLHGGCWQGSLPGTELMDYLAEDLRKAGVAVWNLEYRRLGMAGGGYPGTFADVAAGMDHLRKIQKEYWLDLTHLVACGHSAGGQLALWAAARKRLPKASALYAADPLLPRAAVSLAGINDLAEYRASGAGACGGPATIDALVGAKSRKDSDLYADTSPAALLPLGIPQLVISGALDPIVPAPLGKAYAAKALKAGDRVEELVIDGSGHFELIDPQSAAWAAIRPKLLAFARE